MSAQNMLSRVWLPQRKRRVFVLSQRSSYLYDLPCARRTYSQRCRPPADASRSTTLRT